MVYERHHRAHAGEQQALSGYGSEDRWVSGEEQAGCARERGEDWRTSSEGESSGGEGVSCRRVRADLPEGNEEGGGNGTEQSEAAEQEISYLCHA